MTDADRLLREIIANPADDVLRLAFADAIEERRGPGDEAWAAFVRVQVELGQPEPECEAPGFPGGVPCVEWNAVRRGWRENWCPSCVGRRELRRRERELWPVVRPFIHNWINRAAEPAIGEPGTGCSIPIVLVRRGFPAVVRCTLAEWRGERCPRCGGSGEFSKHEHNYRCGRCRGSGRIPGIGPRLAQAWPVERVETEKRPFKNGRGGFSWFDSEWPHDGEDGHGFPVEVFRLLKGGNSEGLRRVGSKEYPTESTALAALSAVLLAEARAQPRR